MLFEISDLKQPEETPVGPPPIRIAPLSDELPVKFVDVPSNADLAKLLTELPVATHIQLITVGQWSLHEMIAHLLHLTGPADCWITSWGISAKPIQSVLEHVRQNRIRQMKMLFDHRVRLQCPQAFQLLLQLTKESKVQVSLTKIHAKVIVLKNDQHQVSVFTSANLTMNPRIESYELTSSLETADHNIAWIERVRAGEKPFTE